MQDCKLIKVIKHYPYVILLCAAFVFATIFYDLPVGNGMETVTYLFVFIIAPIFCIVVPIGLIGILTFFLLPATFIVCIPAIIMTDIFNSKFWRIAGKIL